jgi:transcriptional regulator with XRE-family HTH domain
MKMTFVFPDGWVIQKINFLGKAVNVPLREFVKAAREKQGVSKGALTKLIGAQHPAYSNWELGRTRSAAIGFQALEELGYSIHIKEDK